MKKIIPVMAMLAVFLAIAGQAQAISSSDFILTSTSEWFDEKIFVYYENSDWSPPTVNLSLNTGGLALVSGSNPATGFSGNIYTWELSAAAPNVYTINLTADDGNGTASNVLVLDLRRSTDPSLVVDFNAPATAEMGKSFNLQVNLNSTGNGPAKDIDVHLDLMDANFSTPQEILTMNNGSTGSVTFTVTPIGACATYLARTITDYWNEFGEPMPSEYANDTFRVIGPDLLIEDLYLSIPNPSVGESVTLYANVRNFGETDSDGFTVTFYRQNPSSGNEIGTVGYTGTLSPLENATVQMGWTVTDSSISAVVSATECNPLNNRKSRSFNTSIYCGDGYCNGDETCSSCPQDCGSCPSPPGPGSPSGGSPGGFFTHPAEPCTVEWVCTEWGPCSPDGYRARVCQNIGTCANELATDKPAEREDCQYVPALPPVVEPVQNETAEDEPVGFWGGITGFVTANGSIIGGIIVLIALATGGFYFWRKKQLPVKIKK